MVRRMFAVLVGAAVKGKAPRPDEAMIQTSS